MTAGQGFALFETAIGLAGVIWSGSGEHGLAGVQLPEGSESLTVGRILQRFPNAREAPPPQEVQRALDRIAGLLDGSRDDLDSVSLDMDGVPTFHQRVYEAVRTIPPGATLSYGEVALLAGSPGAARAVGQALARNPFAVVVPCHRVIASGGKLGGFSANGGLATKRRMLALEGVSV